MSKRVAKPKYSQFEKTLRGTLAYNIRLYRFENGISQEELAFRCELDRTYISAVERCIWNIALSNIEKIAEALRIEPWQLLVPPVVAAGNKTSDKGKSGAVAHNPETR